MRVNMKLTTVEYSEPRGNKNEESARRAQEKEAQKAAEQKRKRMNGLGTRAHGTGAEFQSWNSVVKCTS